MLTFKFGSPFESGTYSMTVSNPDILNEYSEEDGFYDKIINFSGYQLDIPTGILFHCTSESEEYKDVWTYKVN